MHGKELKDWVQKSMREYMHSRDSELRERVAEACKPLVYWVLKTQFIFIPRHLSDDAFSEGYFGLASAIEGYSGRSQFNTYAVVCIYRRVLDLLKSEKNGSVSSLNRPVFDGVELGDILSAPASNHAYQSDAESVLKVIYRELRRHLSERECKVIELRYGLRGRALTLAEISKRFTLSRERIRQIELKALRKLRSSGLEVLLE